MEAAYRIASGAPIRTGLVHVDHSGDVTPLAEQSSATPNVSNGRFQSFGLSEVTPSGDFLFSSLFDRRPGPSGFSGSFWKANTAGVVQVLAAEDELFVSGATEILLDHIDLGSSPFLSYSSPAFLARMTGEGVTNEDDLSVWNVAAGQAEIVVREGDLSPIPNNTTLKFIDFDDDVRAESGQTVVRAHTTRAFSRPDQLLSHFDGKLNLVAKLRDTAPTLIRTGSFDVFQTAVPNGHGAVAFTAELSASGDGSEDEGLWLYEDGQLEIIIQEGMPAPGIDRPARLAFAPKPYIADDGSVLFRSAIVYEDDDSRSQAFFRYTRDEGVELVLFSGQRAPGTADDVVFVGGNAVINDNGRAVFYSFLEGPGVDLTNDFGIWAEDPEGRLQLIVREGDEIEVSPGQFETVQHIPVTDAIMTHLPTTFNSRGEIAFHARLSGGSGVFVSDAVAIPEPKTAAIALILGIFAAMIWNRGVGPRIVVE